MKESYYLKTADNPEQIAEISREAIQTVYPLYYPRGAVEYFLNYHSLDNIRKAFEKEEVYLFIVENRAVGTGTIRNNEICRLFILPKFQRKGYGSRLRNENRLPGCSI